MLLAGYLARYAPDPLLLPFVAHLLLLVPAALGLLLMPELGHPGRAAAEEAAGNAEVLTPRQSRGVVLSCCVSFLAFAVLALFLSLGPTIVKAALNDQNVLLGAYVALDMLGCSAATQIFAKRASLQVKLLLGMTTLVLGLASLVWAAHAANAAGIFLTTALGGIGQGLSFLGAVELLERASPASRHGSLVSILYAASYAGGSVPVVAVGIGASVFGILPALFVFAACAAATGLVLLLLVQSFSARHTSTLAA